MTTLETFWRWVAAGGRPDDEYIRSTGIPARFFDEVRAQAAEIVALKLEGSMAAARQLGWERAAQWKDRLGDEPQPPSSDPLRNELDPRKLAEPVQEGVSHSRLPRRPGAKPYDGPSPRKLVEGLSGRWEGGGA